MDYRYTSTEERVYADRALVVSPGDVVDWAIPPADGHWAPVNPDEEHDDADSGGEQHKPDADTEPVPAETSVHGELPGFPEPAPTIPDPAESPAPAAPNTPKEA